MGKFKLYENDTVVATRQLGTVPEGAVGNVDDVVADCPSGRSHFVVWLCGHTDWYNPDDLGLYLYNDLPAEAGCAVSQKKPFHPFL